ncbi:MAG: hypothetical protein JNK37_02570 [Verrucomicrobiales bacterium]|nr:hypothetical protein [Verrucomicrobiales bacterium]
MRNHLFRSAILLALALTLNGCNTVGGLGEDLQILGEKMEQKADQVYSGDRY